MKDDVTARECAACGIHVRDLDRKSIGAIINIDGENTHPPPNFHRSGKVCVVPINGKALEFSIPKPDASRWIAVHAVALDARRKSARMCHMEVE